MRVISAGECMVEFFRRDDGLWRQGFAGDTLNVAWAMRAILSAEHQVSYLTRVGMDAFSEAMVDFLADAGIDTALIGRDETRRPGLYTIETDVAGERDFTYWRSDAAARRLAEDAAALRSAFGSADLGYVSGITLAILPAEHRDHLFAALGARKERSFRVAFAPNIRPALWSDAATMREAVTEAARRADIVPAKPAVRIFPGEDVFAAG
jgi:2-dehydro-3-deoxygluconokinase